MSRPRAPAARCALRRGQQGVSLFIALIVLVGMMLTGVGLMRSVDTNTVISGNLAFKQSTVQAADQGIEAAYQWLVANAGGSTLNNTDVTAGYYFVHPATEPDWNEPESWDGAINLAADAAGNAVSYVVHRMCTQPDTAYNGLNGAIANECALTYVSGASNSGGSMSVDAPVFVGNSALFYRVTTRTAGPRGTFSVTQAVVRLTN